MSGQVRLTKELTIKNTERTDEFSQIATLVRTEIAGLSAYCSVRYER